MNPKFKSVETKYRAERESFFRGMTNLDRRSFLKVSGAAAASGVVSCQSFQSVAVAGETGASQRNTPFRFAYISDSHLYEKKINDRFARSLLRAVEDMQCLVAADDPAYPGKRRLVSPLVTARPLQPGRCLGFPLGRYAFVHG